MLTNPIYGEVADLHMVKKATVDPAGMSAARSKNTRPRRIEPVPVRPQNRCVPLPLLTPPIPPSLVPPSPDSPLAPDVVPPDAPASPPLDPPVLPPAFAPAPLVPPNAGAPPSPPVVELPPLAAEPRVPAEPESLLAALADCSVAGATGEAVAGEAGGHHTSSE